MTSYLNVAALRSALIEKSPISKKFCINCARLVAAYYLDFTLYLAQPKNDYISLFLWSQLSFNDFPAGALPLSREELSSVFPLEFTPRLPAMLFVHFGHSLEAILYADHFNDRRSALLLRIQTDANHGLSLVDDYVNGLVSEVLPDHLLDVCSNLTCQSSTDSNIPSVSKPEEALPRCHSLATSSIVSILELDVILANGYISRLESTLLEKLDVLFAELTPQVIDVSLLPRPPLYAPPSHCDVSIESSHHLKMHILVHTLLVSLHKTNRLTKQRQLIGEALQNKDADNDFNSVLLRVFLVILRDVYRDCFSRAVEENWENLPELALKYRTLIDENEGISDLAVIRRWQLLADDRDIQTVDMFMDFLREHFVQENSLPSLNTFTREIWHKSLIERGKQSVEVELDWISGVLNPDITIDVDSFDRMKFIANTWTLFPCHDRSLVAIRLQIAPNDIVKPKKSRAPEIPERSMVSAHFDFQLSPRNLPLTERVSPSDQLQSLPPPDRLFTPREDLVAYYARKAKELAKKRESKRQIDQRMIKSEPRYLRHTMHEQITTLIKSQRVLESEVEKETEFLHSLSDPTRISDGSPSLAKIKKMSKKQLQRDFDEVIKGDLNRLNEKLDAISEKLRTVGSDSTYGSNASNSDRTQELDVEDLEPAVFDYNSMAAVMEAPPEMEKLDFSALSPLPTIRRRASSPVNFSASSSMEHDVLPKQLRTETVPIWMRLLPLEARSARPLLQWNPNERQRQIKTERSIQTDVSGLHPHTREDSGFVEQLKPFMMN